MQCSLEGINGSLRAALTCLILMAPTGCSLQPILHAGKRASHVDSLDDSEAC